MCAPWMVNIAQKVECSKGWKSRKRWGRARKLSKWQGGLEWSMHWSKPVCSICTDEQKPHTEAIRSDEVAHDTEVQHLARGQYQNSRCGSDRYKDIHLTEGGLEPYELWIEKSAEVIVVDGNEPIQRIGSLTKQQRTEHWIASQFDQELRGFGVAWS